MESSFLNPISKSPHRKATHWAIDPKAILIDYSKQFLSMLETSPFWELFSKWSVYPLGSNWKPGGPGRLYARSVYLCILMDSGSYFAFAFLLPLDRDWSVDPLCSFRDFFFLSLKISFYGKKSLPDKGLVSRRHKELKKVDRTSKCLWSRMQHKSDLKCGRELSACS